MYKTYTLPNGITVVTEKIAHFRSVSFGLWFKVGSVYEAAENNGASHFIEHMLFKGTYSRTAKQLADVMDGVGGQLNAFTAKEYSCYYYKVLDEHIGIGLELLADMILHSKFDSEEIEKEKGVILEEILMYEDSPEDLAYDLLAKALFEEHPLSNPILGEKHILEGFTREKILSFFGRHYFPDLAVISVAGNFEDDQLLELLYKHFGGWEHSRNGKTKDAGCFNFKGNILFRQKDTEQSHICIAYPGISLLDERIYSMLTFNNLFGGSVSSRLFQKIREDMGLVYSVASSPSNYTHGGFFAVYASMKPSNATDVLMLIMEEIALLKNYGLAPDELNKSKEQLKGNYILGLESTGSRMNAIGRAQLLLGKITTPAEVLQKIDEVTMDDALAAMDMIFSGGIAGASIIGKEDLSGQISTIMSR